MVSLISARLYVFVALASFHGSPGEVTNVQEKGGFIFFDTVNRKYSRQIYTLCRTWSGWVGASEESSCSVRSVKERYCCCCGAQGTGAFVSQEFPHCGSGAGMEALPYRLLF